MNPIILHILCGLSAGLLGGYLGLGGGIIMVPFLTVLAGVPIKSAVPISVTAIVVTSLASSNQYLKKGMVDMELVIVLTLFMIIGTVSGSFLSRIIPAESLQILLSVIVLYTAFSLLKSRKEKDHNTFIDNRNKNMFIVAAMALFTGIMSGLLGIGGGVIIIPVMYLLIGLPLTTARGTSSLMIGFSAAGASLVYLINDQVDFEIVSAVIIGILIGGKIGGYFGTLAKPIYVKVLFFVIMIYLAYRLSYEPIMELL